MFRCMLMMAFASLLGGLVPIASSQADGPQVQNTEPMVIEGTVVAASAGQVSLRAADGKEHSFKPNETTRINVNGKPGKLDDLKPGVPIRVMVDKQGKVISISTVDDRKR